MIRAVNFIVLGWSREGLIGSKRADGRVGVEMELQDKVMMLSCVVEIYDTESFECCDK